jgi:hypothetical protein
MKFTHLKDLIQYFANEYIKPGDSILIVENSSKDISDILSFIHAEPYFVSKNKSEYTDFVVNEYILPFEEHSFDIILDFSNENLKEYLKYGGVLFKKGKSDILYNYFVESGDGIGIGADAFTFFKCVS